MKTINYTQINTNFKMEMTSLIIVGVVVLVAIITIIGILSRYRKCKSDELLVVYGKTEQERQVEVNEAKLKAEVIIPAEKAKEKAKIEAEAVKSVAILEAANAKVFEHIQLGNVTVYGDSNTAGQFMANMAKNLAPSLEIARNLPIADSLKQIITGKKPEESPANGDKFPPVK